MGVSNNRSKTKTIDVAVGTPVNQYDAATREFARPGDIERMLLSCEAKSAMTEHGKSQPRLFDELESSYTIVDNGDSQVIAVGIEVVNIADRDWATQYLGIWGAGNFLVPALAAGHCWNFG